MTQNNTIGAKSWFEFKWRLSNLMEEKSISSWGKSQILKILQRLKSSWGQSQIRIPYLYHFLGVYILGTKLADYSPLRSYPVWVKIILIFFCTYPYSIPIICILLFTAVFVSPYNSFLCFLTINEDSHKTKDYFGHMQTLQITHRRKGLWQGFPCHHTNMVTWNKRKATFTCC